RIQIADAGSFLRFEENAHIIRLNPPRATRSRNTKESNQWLCSVPILSSAVPALVSRSGGSATVAHRTRREPRICHAAESWPGTRVNGGLGRASRSVHLLSDCTRRGCVEHSAGAS